MRRLLAIALMLSATIAHADWAAERRVELAMEYNDELDALIDLDYGSMTKDGLKGAVSAAPTGSPYLIGAGAGVGATISVIDQSYEHVERMYDICQEYDSLYSEMSPNLQLLNAPRPISDPGWDYSYLINPSYVG